MKKSLLFRNGGSSFCKICLLVCLLLVGFINLNAQNVPNKKVTLDLKNVPLIDVLLDIQKQTGVNFAYEKTQVARIKPVTISVKDATIEEVLKMILKNTGFTYKTTGNNIAIVKLQEKKDVELIAVKGKITDEKGNPLPGATVVIHGTTQGVSADVDGRYVINVQPDGVLYVSFIGYKPETVLVKGKNTVNVALNPTAENIEEVTVVAFGEQKKESVVSAITTVKASDLKSSNSDLTASFAGKIAGMIGWQTGGIPGALTEEEMNTKFYIRGITSFQTGANIDPLILLDGVETSKLDLARIAPEDIESFSVLKDASATAMYGARGANGVILVTTKKGEEGSVYTSFRYEVIASMPTKEIETVDPITYMKMYNQAQIGRDPLASPKYSVEHINRTASGKYPSWLYPKNDWYDILFKDKNFNHHLGLNIRGGSKVVQYYASLNYNYDNGMLKTDRLNQFDCNIKNSTTSFRTNLNIDLKAGIKLIINAYASLDKYHGPRQPVNYAYEMAFNASPVDYAPVYPADDTYNWPHIRFGSTTVPSSYGNPYMAIHSGYNERKRYSTINRVEYIQNLTSLIKGLELRASVSLNQQGYYVIGYSTSPFYYTLASYDFETGKHQLRAMNPETGNRTLNLDRTTTSTSSTQVTYEGRLLHTAAWGGVDKTKHQTSLTGVFQLQEGTSYPPSSVLNGFPNRNMSFSMRGSYGFKDRYFAEASFGYNGSERFSSKNKMGFFPAAGFAWIVSKENFMRPVSNLISFLKFRASYGQVGNDGIVKEPRFVYLPLIGSVSVTDPEPNTVRMSRYAITAYANENIEWEIAEQVNFGWDMKLFKGLVDITLDAYQEIRHNVLGNRLTIPVSMGLEQPPLDNIGKTRSRGIDFSGKIQHAFSPDLWVILNGTLTYNKVTYREIEETQNKPQWQRKVGQEISQAIGYIAEGLFQDQAEIDNAPVQGGDVMPGDIRYRDINEDGVIDVNDATYIGFPETPSIIYGFNGFVNYKNWEFSFAFQGSGRRSFFMNPSAISPFSNNRAMLKAINDDHWSPDNMSTHPFWPRLSTSNVTYHNPQEDWYNPLNSEVRKSTYFMRECSFLRCTSLELAYNLPRKLMERVKMQNVKFFVRANNPFIITNFKVWDVELGEDGFKYPIQKTYSIGLNVSF